MVGFSLSFCIKDIIEGKVNLDDVELIISATRAVTPEGWDKVIRHYRVTYWYRMPHVAELICRSLIKQGMVYEPRADGHEPINISQGHWMTYGF
jgi:hypothetical protein